ncbi:hypothetical protein KKG48_01660 [Patescibacteria group bacterium]|nr:hypothetical protein [Patescibacteria group bacterium]MCG2695254.1 hypothetical protein [Candidatus Parcubacteria bacterium]
METLGKLFGSFARVKIMKLFLSNEEAPFDNDDISKRAKVSLPILRKELNLLNKAGFIKKRIFYKEIKKKIEKTNPPATARHKRAGTKPAEIKIIKKKTNGWVLDEKFVYTMPLYNLLVNMTSFNSSSITKKLNKVGKLKLVLVAGAFIHNPDSRVDIMVVGDGLKSGALENAISVLESEMGKELKYVVFKTEDFKYRMNVYDKLVRDILDYPHQKIINRLNL